MSTKKPSTGSGVVVVKIEGDVDRSSIEAAEWMLSQRGPTLKHAVLDLSDATGFDINAGSMLVARRRVLKARGGEFAVAAGSVQVRHVIRAGSGAEVQVLPTVADAMAWVKGELVAAGPNRPKTRAR